VLGTRGRQRVWTRGNLTVTQSLAARDFGAPWRRNEDAAEGATPGRKLLRVKDESGHCCGSLTLAFSPSSNPTSAASLVLTGFRSTKSHFARSVSWSLPSVSQVVAPSTDTTSRTSRRPSPSTVVAPVAVSVWHRRLGKVVKRPSKRANDTSQPVGEVLERAKVTSGQQHFISGIFRTNSPSHNLPALFIVSRPSYFFFFKFH